MTTGVLCALLAAAPVKLAAPGIQTVGFEKELGDVYLERIITLAKNSELQVITHRDIEQVLGLDRQKQLMGCDTSSCAAELAGALGVDALLYGTLAKTGGSITLNIRVVRASDGTELASTSVRGQNEDEVQDWIDLNARRFGEKIVARVRGGDVAEGTPSWIRWAVGALGVGLVAGGGITLGIAHSTADQAMHPSAGETEQIPSIVSRGRSFEQTSVILFALGGIALASSVLLFIFHADSPGIALVPTDRGAVFALGGHF
ncbi:MAG: FlgO family outer membrane protein [Myxococcaceae bacterium]